MTPRASKIRVVKLVGPHEIRLLSQSTATYLQVVRDATEVVRLAMEEGTLPRESESDYTRLMLSLTQMERDLRWVGDRCAVLLGESDGRCPTCGSESRGVMGNSPCLDGWHYAEQG